MADSRTQLAIAAAAGVGIWYFMNRPTATVLPPDGEIPLDLEVGDRFWIQDVVSGVRVTEPEVVVKRDPLPGDAVITHYTRTDGDFELHDALESTIVNFVQPGQEVLIDRYKPDSWVRSYFTRFDRWRVNFGDGSVGPWNVVLGVEKRPVDFLITNELEDSLTQYAQTQRQLVDAVRNIANAWFEFDTVVGPILQ